MPHAPDGTEDWEGLEEAEESSSRGSEAVKINLCKLTKPTSGSKGVADHVTQIRQ